MRGSTLTTVDPKFFHVHAHSRDCNQLAFSDADGNCLLDYDGYVPLNLSVGQHDDVRLTIDVDTGKIVGWDREKFLASYRELYAAHDFEEDDDE